MFESQNPKVIFIDDKIEDVKPLFSLFSQSGIPFLYFTGDESNLPSSPYSNIRIVFSDINLVDDRVADINDPMIQAKLHNTLSKIIAENSNAVQLFFWTQSEDGNDEQETIKNFVQKYFKFTSIQVRLIKKPSKDRLEAFTLEELNQYIRSKIETFDTYDFFMKWESQLSNEVSNFTSDLFKIIDNNSKKTNILWNDSGKLILGNLALSYSGGRKLIEEDDNSQFAIRKLNECFKGFLVKKYFKIASLKFPKKLDIDFSCKTKLNSLLFFEKNIDSSRIENGNMYRIDDSNLYDALKKDILQASIPEDISVELISIIITPPCDLANNKILKSSGKTFQRIVYGLMVEINSEEQLSDFLKANEYINHQKKLLDKYFVAEQDCSTELLYDISCLADNPNIFNKKVQIHNEYLQKIISTLSPYLKPTSADRYFKIQPFEFNGKNYIIILHLGTITSHLFTGTEESFLRVSESLLNDIQTKIANNINRIGNSML